MHLCIIYIALYNKKLLFMHAFNVFFCVFTFLYIKNIFLSLWILSISSQHSLILPD